MAGLLKRFRQSYFLYSFLRDPVAVTSFALFVVLAMSALLAPVIAPHNPFDGANIDIMDAETPPCGRTAATPPSCWAPTTRGATCSRPFCTACACRC